MDERDTEKRLKEIRNKLKRLKERRAEYIRGMEKAEKYGKIWKRGWEQSPVFSALISGIISITTYVILDRFSAPEYVKISTIILMFFTLIYVLYILNTAKKETLREKYLKTIDCLIEGLEKEEEEIITKFPDADRWVPSVKTTMGEKSSSHRITLLLELLFFVISPTLVRGAYLLLYLGVLGSVFAFTEIRRHRELKRWEKECEERGKIIWL